MKSVQNLQGITLGALVFLLPLFFLPLTTDAFDFNKMLLIATLITLSLLLWSINLSVSGFKLRLTPFDLPVLAFTLAVAASGIFVSPNKLDAFVLPGSASQVVAAGIIYFLVSQYIGGGESGKRKLSILNSLLVGGALAGVVALFAGIGLLSKISVLPVFVRQVGFNTLGGVLPALTLFAILLPLAWSRVLVSKGKARVLGLVSGVLLVLGFVAQGFHALPGKALFPKLLPVETGWSIALETLKQKPLLGVGVGNFAEAFSRFKPQTFNATDAWNLSFFSSSNWYLNLFAVAGFLGLGSFVWIVYKLVHEKRADSKDVNILRGVLIFTAALFLLVPAGFVSLVTFFVLLGILGSDLGKEISLREGRGSLGVAQLLLSVGFVALFVFGIYKMRPIYAAEMVYKNALESVTKNDGLATYNQMREAIRLNPRAVGYRTTNSQVNLALANTIASNAAEKAQKEGGQISEEDRSNISKLIQQAISEGKAGVSLAPRNSAAWANLARIYRSLMGLAEGADQFAIATYQQAISLDPVNPTLRIELGGVLYALKRYDDAVNAFDLAVAAKPDLANAHYNLAIALREADKSARALQEFNTTLALVKEGSDEYNRVKAEFDELKKKVDEAAAQSAQVAPGSAGAGQAPLQAPQAPQTTVEPKIDLPEGTEPPSAAGESTTATPTPAPTQN